MKEYSIGSDVWFTFKGTVCSGQVIAVDGDWYTVSFVYSPGDERAPESVIYTIAEKDMLQNENTHGHGIDKSGNGGPRLCVGYGF